MFSIELIIMPIKYMALIKILEWSLFECSKHRVGLMLWFDKLNYWLLEVGILIYFLYEIIVVLIVHQHLPNTIWTRCFQLHTINLPFSEVQYYWWGVRLYLIKLLVTKRKYAYFQGNRVQMQRLVFYYKPTVTIVVVIFLLVPEFT